MAIEGEPRPFKVELLEDGGIKLCGSAAATTLMRIALAAKFRQELQAEFLLSPYVNEIIKQVGGIVPRAATDWSSPAVLTPPEFLEVVKVVTAFRDDHDQKADLAELLKKGLSPYEEIPMARLGVGADPN